MPWTRSKPATLALALAVSTACGSRIVEPEVEPELEPCEHRPASDCERDGLAGCPCALGPMGGMPDWEPLCEDSSQGCFRGYCVDLECQDPLEQHLCEAALECEVVADLDACVADVGQCLRSLDEESRDVWLGTAYGCLAFTAECNQSCMEFLLGCPP